MSDLDELHNRMNQYARHGQPEDEETTRLIADVISELFRAHKHTSDEVVKMRDILKKISINQTHLRLRVYGDGDLDVPGMQEINHAVRSLESSVEMMRRQLWRALGLLVVLVGVVLMGIIIYFFGG